jgi:glucokinase
MNGSGALYLALDFGGTKLTAATRFAGGSGWAAHARQVSPAGGRMADDWGLMVALADEVLAGRKAAGIGVSFGGPADFQRGIVLLSHHVPGWEQMPLAARLTARYAAPTLIDNDANAAALGEQRYGAGSAREHLLFVTVSTGVGGGWVLNGQPWRGSSGVAGEIGHMVVDPDGPRCLCGKNGCVERLASGPYMAADAVAALVAAPGAGPLLWEKSAADLTRIDGRLVAACAAAGDPLARRLLLRGARALGVGLGNAANLVDPGLILLGGGVTKAGPLWWDTVRATVRDIILPEVQVAIEPAALGDDAPLWGAAVLAAAAADGGRRV